MAGRLIEHVRAALAEAGDLKFVQEGLDRLLRTGSGAMRQRRAYERGNDLQEVVDDLIEATVA
ncbi:hypothetical protein WBK31_26360 [Nonomuraea sp. N2-4H]